MAPKRKADQVVEATPATAAGGRSLRSSGRATRSTPNVKFIELPDTRKSPSKKKKKEVKGKVKKEEDSEVAEVTEGEGSENVLEEEDPNKTVIIIEHCKQCSSFKKTANEVKEGLEKSECDVTVKLNPKKPRKGCFEIRQQGGKTFISLLDMKRPFKPMKDLDIEQVVSDIVNELSNAS